MKREIRFRAKNKQTGEWMCWDAKTLGSADDNFWLSQDTSTLGQFTGLKDKNGREIYEGDVVKLENGTRYTVVWQSGGFPLFMVGGLFESDGEMSQQTEIIGNIYENPDLLTPTK